MIYEQPARATTGLRTEGRSNAPTLQRSNAPPAFSLIEIMVTIGLLSLIVLGLLAMFTQTQQAFLGSRTQSDVLGTGRAIGGMLAREIEQIKPAKTLESNPNPLFYRFNFYTAVSTNFLKPLYQGLPGSNLRRTNIVEDLFFVSQSNQDWVATGYRVLSRDNPPAGSAGLVGALYRYSYSQRRPDDYNFSWDRFYNTPRTNLSVIADGIVHFCVRAFDTNGLFIDQSWTPRHDFQNPPYHYLTNAATYYFNVIPTAMGYSFWSNAVPAYVELELGILEPRTLERYRSLPDPTGQAQRLYLSNHAAQVQLFRQRIPIHNLDFSAYQ